MTISAKIIADSQFDDHRLTTFQIRLHRFMLPEITRHRVLSFSVGSNRAVPARKIIEQAERDPALPIYWGKNKPGMSADGEIESWGSMSSWRDAAFDACYHARDLQEIGLHKQVTNRLLEPFQWTDMIVTGTEWDNFFALRLDSAAQPEIQEVARQMKSALESSTPRQLKLGDWHLPYADRESELDLETRKLCSAARVARVSYLNHDQSEPDVEKDIRLAETLRREWHWSPFEAQATPMNITSGYKTGLWSLKEVLEAPGYTHVDCNLDVWSGNFRGFLQHRKLIDGTSVPSRQKHAWEK